MAVYAVVGGVDGRAREPLGVGNVPLKHLVPGAKPVEILGLFGPESLGIVLGSVPGGLIGFDAAEVSLGGEVGRGREDSGLVQKACDRALAGLRRHRKHSAVGFVGRRHFKAPPSRAILGADSKDLRMLRSVEPGVNSADTRERRLSH